jgi:Flp pilus assembly protein TadG
MPVRGGHGFIQALLRSRSGSPAIEFALIAPVMIILLVGSYDVTQLLVAQTRVVSAAREIVEIATELSIQTDQTMSLTTTQAYQAQSAIYAVMPGLKLGSDKNSFSVTLSAVVFIAAPSGCTGNCYIAKIAWSTPFARSTTPIIRPCGIIPQVAPTEHATIADLPTNGITSLTSMVVADVSYTYQPLFTTFIIGPVTLRQTAFLPPRTGTNLQYVEYDIGNAASNPSVCPGYL